MRKYWLMKSEPNEWSWDDQVNAASLTGPAPRQDCEIQETLKSP